MNTIISSWQIVSIVEKEMLIGEVLWGIVVDDPTCRFAKDDYVCTSQIMEANLDINLVKTASGSLYQVIGEGQKAQVQMKDFELLRHGFSPEQINLLNLAPNGFFH
ncbi:MAG: hypothetical protein ABJK37_01365 [Paraglaciecola sp.]|uniref:hypothetical protein n=1 Tax=Paraglaciecola sp. TaxID=1920173 RepID=UPI00329735AF